MSRPRKLLIIFASWTFVAVFFAVHVVLSSRAMGRPESFHRALSIFMTGTIFWFAVTPLIVGLSRRFRLVTPHAARNAFLHLGLSMLFAVAAGTVFIFLAPFIVPGFPERPFLRHLTRVLASEPLDMVRYWGVVAIEHALNYYNQAREREKALAEVKLEVLKRQLQPHFLFNTLNSISVLMFENATVANRMLLRLSELLRAGLATDSPHEVSLEDELAFLDRYLEIERMRFGDRLTIEMNIERATLAASVPNLILQPIVENAIRYGVAAVDRPATVSIKAQKEGSELRLEVRDDGPGIARDAKRGVGLSNTEARLRQLYGTEQKLELTSPHGGGLLVSIVMPFRIAMA